LLSFAVSNYIYIYNAIASTNKLSQPVEGSTRVEVNKEKASVAFFDGAGKVRLVYSAPTAKLSNNQTVTLGLDWDPSASAIAITLPEPRSPPMVIAFAVGLKYIELKGDKQRLIPGRTPTPEVKEKDDVASKVVSHGRTSSFSGVKYHTFKLDHSWNAEIYGGSNVLLTLLPGKFPKQPHAVLPNIDVTLGLDGAAEFSAGDWKVPYIASSSFIFLSVDLLQFKLTPIFVPTPPVPHRGDGVHVLRGEDGEIGLYHDKVASRHFFIVGKAPPTNKFTLKLAVISHLFLCNSSF
jgi:hypothetical protein